MAKHRKISERSLRGRTLVGGILAGGALAVAGPAGAALAVPTHTGNASADAVGRAGLDNPAPGVRAVQAVGDQVFNQKTPVNKALDDSELGRVYHLNYGTTSADGITPGKNGVMVGELNVNAGKYYYDQAQAAGVPLPGEKDLPGVLPKVLSGNTSAAKSGSSAKPSNCTAAAGKTKVSAQAASC
ncbi:hypothetical protein M2272_005804 [Mycobacterium frederiksbergense]|uniref:Uncharacterized protein n=1 Tax=Mycolicibacterium frederiksbergense TaxID=117567 RepID=A0ABT6L853_9MYCO|nr:hypothetical protein [Mycolicibacterium frederiksbergense]MDH6199136.1 hypothetical protein [Mycolicibacterium frederiksbergense]